MVEFSMDYPVKEEIYTVKQFVNCFASGTPDTVTSLTFCYDYKIWELFCGFALPPTELLHLFEDKQHPIKLLPAAYWEEKYKELVEVQLPDKEKAWRWPCEPLGWNTEPLPPEEEIEKMYHDRVNGALSKFKKEADANPHTPNFIQMFWSCINAFTSVRELELDFSPGWVFNWQIGRPGGAGWRIPNFTPEYMLVQEMLTVALPQLSSLTTAKSNQMHKTPIEFIGKWSGLQILKISACTGSSPEELATAIRNNTHLEELHISANKPSSVEVEGNYSVTGDVIRAAKSLKIITIEEQPYQGQRSFLSIDVIDALLAHANTLTTLHIKQDIAEFITEPEILDALIRVLPQLKSLLNCQINIRVKDDLLSKRGYVARGTHDWAMEEYMPRCMTGVHPEIFNSCNANCIRDWKREPTGGYEDKYFYFEGEGWG